MTAPVLAIACAALALLPVIMHFALAAGAPLGRFTVGGRFPRRLPPAWCALAGLPGFMALVVLDRGGVLSTPLPQGLFWPVVGVTLLTCIANAVSPSRPERLVWTPVTDGNRAGLVMASISVAPLPILEKCGVFSVPL